MIRSFQHLFVEMSRDAREREAASAALHPTIPEIELLKLRMAKGAKYAESVKNTREFASHHAGRRGWAPFS